MNSNPFSIKLSFAENLLVRAQSGDAAARENLLEDSKPFIHKAACRYCYKQLQWGRDDELSIALIAFNEAIDKYIKEEKKVPFLVFARLLIKYRLIDFFRQENKTRVNLNLKDGSLSIEESRMALEKYSEEMAIRECREEIKQYEALLDKYNLSLMELAGATPKHKSVRRYLIKVANLLANEHNLSKYFIETKRLPLKDLEQISGVSRKKLEKHRKYIVALSLIFCYPEEYTYLKSYLED